MVRARVSARFYRHQLLLCKPIVRYTHIRGPHFTRGRRVMFAKKLS